MRRAPLLVLLLLLAACAPVGSTSAPEFTSLVAQAVPPNDGQLFISEESVWYPNTDGFSDLRDQSLTQAVPGVLIVATRAVVFAQWDGDRYNVVKEWRLVDLTDAQIDIRGFGRRLVLQKTDYSYDAFTVTQETGSKASEYLLAHITRGTR
jgi:hypothetical protein